MNISNVYTDPVGIQIDALIMCPRTIQNRSKQYTLQTFLQCYPQFDIEKWKPFIRRFPQFNLNLARLDLMFSPARWTYGQPLSCQYTFTHQIPENPMVFLRAVRLKNTPKPKVNWLKEGF